MFNSYFLSDLKFISSTHDIVVEAVADTQAALVELHRRRRQAIENGDNDVHGKITEQITEFTRMRNALNNIVFSVRDFLRQSPNRLYTESAILLQFFENNNLVGFAANSQNVHQTIMSIRTICEQLTRPKGASIMVFRQVLKLIEVIFETKIALSLYYHSLDSFQAA